MVKSSKSVSFFCIKSSYWRFSHLSLHSFISTAIFCIMYSTVFHFVSASTEELWIYIFVIKFLILSVTNN